MPTYEVQYRTTSPTTVATVEAETRQHAIQQTLDGAAENETVEVMQVTEMPSEAEVAPQSRK